MNIFLHYTQKFTSDPTYSERGSNDPNTTSFSKEYTGVSSTNPANLLGVFI